MQTSASISLAKTHHMARVKGEEVLSVSSKRSCRVIWPGAWIQRRVKDWGHFFNLPYFAELHFINRPLLEYFSSNNTTAQPYLMVGLCEMAGQLLLINFGNLKMTTAFLERTL